MEEAMTDGGPNLWCSTKVPVKTWWFILSPPHSRNSPRRSWCRRLHYNETHGSQQIRVSQHYIHPSPESMELAVTRLEALNERKLDELGIVSVIPKMRQYCRSSKFLVFNMPGWRNRQTQRT